MKTHLLRITMMVSGLMVWFSSSAQTNPNARYIGDLFSDITVTSNVRYDSTRSFNILYGSGYPNPTVNANPFISVDLLCDIYEPTGDSITERPVVIVAHTGSYIPAIANRQSTGNKNDSSIVELCRRFAQKGYVAVAMNYRQGWRATSTIQEVATQDLIQATYRGIQDVRNCIRFLRTNASTYGIDTSKIIVGGQGTGGYIALALGTVDKESEIITNPKFLRGDFTPMVNIDTMGDWNGIGGHPYFNVSGDAAVSGNAHMIFNYGGSMGDSTWLESNSLPMVGLHVVSDPFAPFLTGDVRVPNGPIVIPSASGAGVVIPMANSLGINNKMNSVKYNDPYTPAAIASTGGKTKNLFALRPQYPVDGAPWEWWDRATIAAATGTAFYVYPMPANGFEADSLSALLNPFMSAAKGRAYVDTVVNFVAPRIAAQLDLAAFDPNTGINDITPLNNQLKVFPVPAHDVLNIELPANMESVSVLDITGRVLLTERLQGTQGRIETTSLRAGIYFAQVKTLDGRVAVKRFVIE